MPSLQCESTQKHFQMIFISYITKKAMEYDGILTMWKYSKNAFRWYSYCIITQKGNETWWHHYHGKVLKKTLPDYTHIVLLPKKVRGMMALLPCESTQKILANDTHIIYFQKRQLMMMPSDAPVTHTVWKYSKNASRWYPYCILPKKAILQLLSIVHTCTNTCQKWKLGSVWENGLVFYTPSRNGNMTLSGIWHSFQIRKLS